MLLTYFLLGFRLRFSVMCKLFWGIALHLVGRVFIYLSLSLCSQYGLRGHETLLRPFCSVQGFRVEALGGAADL